ncbi:hypothetical protein [Clostridium sp. Marseille-P2415]|uniref:hypothetical protein n=1 Tax=Clostridium sp. Marseille-P2415 TaxID=1805471 RepID=UPI0009887D52|nr:hypothetical protein [Clostridium sp. Marseille-P2415]
MIKTSTKIQNLVTSLLLILTLVFILEIPASAASNQWIYGDGKNTAYSIRLDSPHFNGDVYHVHFYKKSTHIYCMRLDNLQVCDKKNSDRSKVPEWLMKEAMDNSKVQERISQYNPSVQNNSGFIHGLLIAGTGILVILAALNIFAGPADDLAAWTLFLKAIAG